MAYNIASPSFSKFYSLLLFQIITRVTTHEYFLLFNLVKKKCFILYDSFKQL